MDARALVFLLVIGVASAYLVNYEDCSSKCTVSEVRIEPCHSQRYCLFKRGNNASISFDFTPDFSATNLKTALFNSDGTMYTAMGIVDACLQTPCPVEPAKTQTFDNTLHLGKVLPKGSYRFRWELWNSDNEKEKCCFMTNVKLH